jgi:hypothetical protein
MASGKHPSFAPEEKRRELLLRLNQISGISIPDDRIDKYPGIALSALTDPDRLHGLLDVVKWAISDMQGA